MTEALSPHRKRLLYRAMHRGFKEADLIVGRYAASRLPSMTEDELAAFEVLLEVPDQDLYAWIIGRKPVPEGFSNPLLPELQDFDVAQTIKR